MSKKKDFQCDCDVCTNSHKYVEIIKKLSEEDREWMIEYYRINDNKLMDGDVNAAKWKGNWPRTQFMRCPKCNHNISREGVEAMNGSDGSNERQRSRRYEP